MFITTESKGLQMNKLTPTVLILDDEATQYGEDFERLVNEDIVNDTDDVMHYSDGHLFFTKICDVASFKEATDLVTERMPDIVLIDNYYCNDELGAKIGEWIGKNYPWIVRIGNSSSLLKENMDYSAEKFSYETISLLRHLRDLPEGMGKFHDPFIFSIRDKTLSNMSNEELVGHHGYLSGIYNDSPDQIALGSRDVALGLEIKRRIHMLNKALVANHV